MNSTTQRITWKLPLPQVELNSEDITSSFHWTNRAGRNVFANQDAYVAYTHTHTQYTRRFNARQAFH